MKVIKAAQAIAPPVIFLIGEPGIGKTTAAIQIPRAILLNGEKNGMCGNLNSQIDMIETPSLEEMTEAYKWCSAQHNKYKFIILDGVTAVLNKYLSLRLPKVNDARIAYGDMTVDALTLFNLVRDNPNQANIAIFQSFQVVDKVTRLSSCKLGIPGVTLRDSLPFVHCDVILHMRVGNTADGQSFRYFQTQPDSIYQAKDRTQRLTNPEPADLNQVFSKITGAT